ncbi:Fe(3+) ABC transporter substrate-binding protein [Halovulum sp. GXIMD14793]
MRLPLLSLFALGLFAGSAVAQGELNLYSSRHYDTDEKLYSDFEEQTGIKINRIEGKADELISRLMAEGDNSPADVLLTVDAGRIWRADNAGLLSQVDSEVLSSRVPAALRHPDGKWFGFSTRARVIYYAKDRVDTPPQTYAALADPQYKGKICIRSSSNIYNQSLLASIVEHSGEEAATDWAKGVLANMARDPQGGDTDQLRGVVSGECDIAIGNTYYFVRGLTGQVDGLTEGIENIGWVFPDQDGNGTHVNVSAGGVVKNAPNRENAIKFLEYLTTESAQQYFAAGNNEYPVVEGIEKVSALESLGDFKRDDLNLSALGANQTTAQKIFNAVGWE